MAESKKVDKAKAKKATKIKFEKIEIKGLTTNDLFSSKFKKIMNDIFGGISYPLFFTLLEDNNTMLVFEQLNPESIKEKILTVNYHPKEIFTKKLVALRESLKEFSDNNE